MLRGIFWLLDQGNRCVRNLNNKVAAITGADSSMGAALAKALAARGRHLAIADVKEAGVEETAAAIGNAGVHLSTHLVNVADRTAGSHRLCKVVGPAEAKGEQ